jgi:GTPase SAR1 family protein
MSGKCVTSAENNTSVDEVVAVRSGSVNKLDLTDCTEANKLMLINYCDVIVICFSVVGKVSYEDVQNVWLKQVKTVYPDKPYLLVNTQIDKRQTNGIRNFKVN